MIYLSEFYFPSQNSEANYLAESPRAKMTCYDSFYPFGLFAGRGLKALDLADVTILYGGNGSGKTTALNVMADALRLQRGAQYNRSDFFPDYVSLCQFHTLHAIPAGSLILTSDDVFDYMLDVRAINDNIDTRRGSLFDEYTEARTAKFQMHSMEDYDRLKQVSAARRYSKSQVARKTLSPNIRTHSNGESAFLMFQEKLRGDALYLLDEPENSLSAARQIALADFLADSARFYGCQFVLATHSPFLLAIPGARIYDLDSTRVQTRRFNACTFDHCNFSGVVFSFTTMKDAWLLNSAFRSMAWGGLQGKSGVFQPFGKIKNCAFRYNDFSGMALNGFDWTGAELQQCTFDDTRLAGASFYGVRLGGTRFTRCDLQKADLRTAEEYAIDLETNKLKGARFSFPDVVRLLDGTGIVIE